MVLKDIQSHLPKKYKILFSLTFLTSVGLLITSTNETLGFHLFGFIFCLIGIALTFVNSYFISKKVLLREQLQAGVISRDLFMEKISVSEQLPEDGSRNWKVLSCANWTVQIFVYTIITVIFIARSITWSKNA